MGLVIPDVSKERTVFILGGSGVLRECLSPKTQAVLTFRPFFLRYEITKSSEDLSSSTYQFPQSKQINSPSRLPFGLNAWDGSCIFIYIYTVTLCTTVYIYTVIHNVTVQII